MSRETDIRKQFESFQKRNRLSCHTIAEIAFDYATLKDSISGSIIAKKYEISTHIFYKSRDYAIICCLVDEATSRLIQKKALANSTKHNPYGFDTRSRQHFEEVFEQRQQFLDSFSEDEICEIACKFVEGTPIREIAKDYNTGVFGIQRLLGKGVSNFILGTALTEAVQKKLGKSVTEFLAKRTKNKTELLNTYKSIIVSIKKRIEVFDYNPLEVCEKNALKIMLVEAETKYEEATQL